MCRAGKEVAFDDFQVDFGRFQLCRRGFPVRLEGLPLQLLMFLVEHNGQLVTREQISSALWSKDVFVDVDQGINTAIRKIRQAFPTMPIDPSTCRRSSGGAIVSLRPSLRRVPHRISWFLPKTWDAPS